MGGPGMTVKLRHIKRFKDRHGQMRYYFRKPGVKPTPLPSPDSPDFMAAYHAAAGNSPAPVKAKERAGAEGSFDRLIADYFKSMKFLRTKPSSQSVTRSILLRFTAKHGHRLVRDMQRQNVEKLMAKMADTPAAANNLLKKLHAVLNYAVKIKMIAVNPASQIEKFREGTHHTWTDHELAQFEARWPLGSRERTGYALALYTGQRRADLVHMAWRHIDRAANTIRVVQDKGGAELDIPIHEELTKALAAWPQKHLAILATPDGRGTSVPGFGNFMADAIDAAGLPDRCVLHGLRKAAARSLAEAGCSAHEIMSITGHKSLAEVQRYCDKASQKRRAAAAIVKLQANKSATVLATQPGKVDK